jgi:hypothetical protein
VRAGLSDPSDQFLPPVLTGNMASMFQKCLLAGLAIADRPRESVSASSLNIAEISRFPGPGEASLEFHTTVFSQLVSQSEEK